MRSNVIQHPRANQPFSFQPLEAQFDLLLAEIEKAYGRHYTRLLLNCATIRMGEKK